MIVELSLVLLGYSPPAKIAAEYVAELCAVARTETNVALGELADEIIMLHNQRVAPGMKDVAH